MKSIDYPYPYFRGLIPEITENIKLISYHQPKRKKGKTKNNFYTLYDLGILGIIKYSKFTLRIMTFFCFIFSIISLLFALVYLIFILIYWDFFDLFVLLIIIVIFLLAFFQIFLSGFIGEYVMSILTQTRKLPLVVEKERINFD